MRMKIVIAGIALAIAFFAYSIREYQKTAAQTAGLVTCAEGQCYWTAHMHAWVRISACGNRINLPKLTGPLSGPHTHTEENILHWHDKLPADPVTKKIINDMPLRISYGLATIGVSLTDTCANNTPAIAKFFVNGEPRADFAEYAWHDRDIIDIVIDARTMEETLRDIQTLPKDFPILGQG